MGRVTSWLNLGLEKKELTSLLGFLSGHTLKSPMTSVVFLKSMNSFQEFQDLAAFMLKMSVNRNVSKGKRFV